MKGKVLFLLLGIVSVSIFSSCNREEEQFLDFKNKTSQEIELVSYSLYGGTKNEISILVSSGHNMRLYSETPVSYVWITFSFDGKEYIVSTGYDENYGGSSVEISESPDSPYGIKSTFRYKHLLLGDDVFDMEINGVGADALVYIKK